MNTSSRKALYILIAIIVVVGIISLIYKGMNSTVPAGDGAALEGEAAANGTGSNTNVQGNTATNPGATAVNLESTAVLTTIIGNALVRVPTTGTDVALTAGESDFKDVTGKVEGHVSAGPIIGFVKTTSGYDVFTKMTVTKVGQSHQESYVALFHVVGESNVKFTSAVLIGDRLPVSSIKASADLAKGPAPTNNVMSDKGYLLAITYLQRKNGEVLTATPTVTATMNVKVINHIVTK
jgi:hypothetical protein